MFYIVLVLAQTVVLPVVSGVIDLLAHDGAVLVPTFGKWFLFWGVGTRLAVAGGNQILRPRFTVENILGIANPGAEHIAQELGFANAAMAAGAIVGVLAGYPLPVAITGGVFMGAAGVRHLMKHERNVKALVAMWTDLLVGVAMVVYVIALVR
jgi:hypothetical protein